MLYNFYVYNRKGKCLLYKEWKRPLNTLADDPIEERKLVFGMLFSLKDLASKLAPPAQGKESLHVIRTNNFALHHYESLSGLIFILNTDSEVPTLHSQLFHIYSNIYVDCIARNPLYQHKLDEPIKCPLFINKVEEYLYSLSIHK